MNSLNDGKGVIQLDGVWLECMLCGGKLIRGRVRRMGDNIRRAECTCKNCGQRHDIYEPKPK